MPPETRKRAAAASKQSLKNSRPKQLVQNSAVLQQRFLSGQQLLAQQQLQASSEAHLEARRAQDASFKALERKIDAAFVKDSTSSQSRKVLSAPKFTSTSFAKQFEFNVSVAEILESALIVEMSDDERAGRLQQALTLLRVRNKKLAIADKNPGFLTTLDREEELEALRQDPDLGPAFVRALEATTSIDSASIESDSDSDF